MFFEVVIRFFRRIPRKTRKLCSSNFCSTEPCKTFWTRIRVQHFASREFPDQVIISPSEPKTATSHHHDRKTLYKIKILDEEKIEAKNVNFEAKMKI